MNFYIGDSDRYPLTDVEVGYPISDFDVGLGIAPIERRACSESVYNTHSGLGVALRQLSCREGMRSRRRSSGL